MKSLSGNQIQDLKELYVSIYKSDDQEITETTANLNKLDKKSIEAMKGEKKKDITKEKKDEKIEKEVEKKEEPITINLPGGGTKKIYPGSDEYKSLKSGESTTSKSDSYMFPDIKNITKNEKGEYTGEVDKEKYKKTYTGKDVNVLNKEIENDLKDPNNKVKKNEVKPKEKPLLSKPIKAKTELGSDIRQVKPSSARDKMIARNEIKLGSDRVNLLRRQNADFQSMKKGNITKQQFMDKYPNSQTAKKFKLSKLESYEPYDLVLDYVLSEGHADTVEEAHYVMTQMDTDTIQTIVEFIGGVKGDGYIGHPRLDIKNPLSPPKKNLKKTTGKDSDKGVQGLGNRATDIENMIKNIP